MEIHGHDAVFSFERRLCRAGTDTRRIVTMVAEHQKTGVLHVFVPVIITHGCKRILKWYFKDPFDLVLGIAEIGHVVHPVAGRRAVVAVLLVQASAHVDHHGRRYGH